MAISHSDLNQQLLYIHHPFINLPCHNNSLLGYTTSFPHSRVFRSSPRFVCPLIFTTRAYIRYNLPYILCLRLHTTRLMRKNGIEIRIKDEVDDERGQRRGVSYSFMDVIITLCLHCLHTLLILIRVGWHFVPSGSWGRRQGCLLWNIINGKLLLQFTEACGTGRPGLFEWPQMDNNNSKWTWPHT